MDRYWLNIYERLVNTDTGFDISCGEKLRRTLFVLDILKDMGFSTTKTRAAFVGKLGNPPYKTLIGHMDTVFPEKEAEKRPFKLESGVVRGPGAADMKGGVITALATLQRAVSEGISDVCVILNVDEELGSKESREIFSEIAEQSKCCLSFEPGRENNGLVISRKGIASLQLEVRGISGHASRLEEGANAVVEIAHKICEIYQFNSANLSLTVNPTIVKGGKKSNITPNEASAYFDVRFSVEHELSELERFIQKVLSTSHIPGTKSTYTLIKARPPMPENREMKRIILEILDKLNINLPLVHASGGADSAFFAVKGVPFVDGLGISGGRFHSEEEFALLDSFEDRVRLSLELLRRFSEV